MEYAWVYHTIIGELGVCASADAVSAVYFGAVPQDRLPQGGPEENALCREAARQIGEYFDGSRKVFTVPLKLAGTAFQKAVWEALRSIPWGQTRTYGQIAAAAGKKSAARAVGGACHRNPVPIIIPCHRVVGSDGSLTGFGGGLAIKRTLLSIEGVI
jgi:methylated-DNA-[protein]-cysteine S-methyltransferase